VTYDPSRWKELDDHIKVVGGAERESGVPTKGPDLHSLWSRLLGGLVGVLLVSIVIAERIAFHSTFIPAWAKLSISGAVLAYIIIAALIARKKKKRERDWDLPEFPKPPDKDSLDG
jgi:hypothetical protein